MDVYIMENVSNHQKQYQKVFEVVLQVIEPEFVLVQQRVSQAINVIWLVLIVKMISINFILYIFVYLFIKCDDGYTGDAIKNTCYYEIRTDFQYSFRMNKDIDRLGII